MTTRLTSKVITRKHFTKALEAAQEARERQVREQYGKNLGLMAERLTGVLRGMEGMTS